jgi:hypothetical protein
MFQLRNFVVMESLTRHSSIAFRVFEGTCFQDDIGFIKEEHRIPCAGLLEYPRKSRLDIFPDAQLADVDRIQWFLSGFCNTLYLELVQTPI